MRISDWSSDVCSSDLLVDRRKLQHEPVDIGAGPHCMDALQRRSATGEAARAAAGRPDQLAGGYRPAVREGRGEGDRVNPGHARIQYQIDVRLLIDAARAEQEEVEGLFERKSVV